MNRDPKNRNPDGGIRVRRGTVDSVDLYEVKEDELQMLAQGDTNSIYLNFGIFLISTAISCITTLCTATFRVPMMETIFLLVSIVGILGGAFLLILWGKGRKSIEDVVLRIKARIPPEGKIVVEEDSILPSTDPEENGSPPPPKNPN